MRGSYSHFLRQFLVTSWYWSNFMSLYPHDPYNASLAWVSLCDTWQRHWGMFN